VIGAAGIQRRQRDFKSCAFLENDVLPRDAHVFGRPITEAEAGLILRHQARLVSARSAAADEQWAEVDDLALTAPNVVDLAAARARRAVARGR
jgi:hypothetical protein